MAPQYKNPPLVEALCEIEFEPGTPWDSALPGLIYNELRTEFPDRKETQGLEIDISTVGVPPIKEFKRLGKLQFWKKDKTALVQVAPYLLVVNVLKPYPSWDEFYRLIEDKLKVYQDVTKVERVKRLGLRYINKIELEGSPVKFDENFNFRPYIAEGLPQNYQQFITGIKTFFNDKADEMLVELRGSEKTQSKGFTVRLDLYFYTRVCDLVRTEDTFGWIENAHTELEKTFELIIKEKLKESFEPLDER